MEGDDFFDSLIKNLQHAAARAQHPIQGTLGAQGGKQSTSHRIPSQVGNVSPSSFFRKEASERSISPTAFFQRQVTSELGHSPDVLMNPQPEKLSSKEPLRLQVQFESRLADALCVDHRVSISCICNGPLDFFLQPHSERDQYLKQNAMSYRCTLHRFQGIAEVSSDVRNRFEAVSENMFLCKVVGENKHSVSEMVSYVELFFPGGLTLNSMLLHIENIYLQREGKVGDNATDCENERFCSSMQRNDRNKHARSGFTSELGIGQIAKPISKQVSKSILEWKSKPIAKKEGKPSSEQLSKNVFEKERKPIPEQETKPIFEQESKQFPELESNPMPEQETEPISEQGSEPILEQKTKPIPEQESEPIPEQKSSQIPLQETKPISEQESESIPELVSSPISEQGISEQESEPIPELESNPVPEQENTSIFEHESKPISEQESNKIFEQEGKSLAKQESKPIFEQEGKSLAEQKSKTIIEQESNSVTVTEHHQQPKQTSNKREISLSLLGKKSEDDESTTNLVEVQQPKETEDTLKTIENHQQQVAARIESQLGNLVRIESDSFSAGSVDCPMFLEHLQPPDYRCENGHSVCQDCVACAKDTFRNSTASPRIETENKEIAAGYSDDQLQSWIEANPDANLLGLEYIVKVPLKERTTGILYQCALCNNVDQTTVDAIFAHIIGRRHRKKCECANDLPIFANNPSAWEEWSSGKTIVDRSGITRLEKNTTLAEWIAANRHIPLVFCNHITFKLSAKKTNILPVQYVCQLCAAVANTVADIVCHLKSDKHIKRSVFNDEMLNDALAQKVVEMTVTNKTKFKVQRLFTCTICQTEPTVPEQMLIHLSGKKHRKLCQRTGSGNIPIDNVDGNE